MKKLLLVINNDAFGRQMARWAVNLKRRSRWTPVIYISSDYMNRHLNECRAEKIVILTDRGILTESDEIKEPVLTGKGEPEWQVKYSVPSQIKKIYQGLKSLLFLLRVYMVSNDIRRQLNTLRKIIREHELEALLISESSPAYGAPYFIKAAHLEKIPVITLPIEKATVRHYAENYLYDPELNLNRPLNRLATAFNPRWVIEHKNRRLVRVVPELILALEVLRISPPNPWLLINNLEDRIAVDSEASFNHYLVEGIPADRMMVVGNAEQDLLFEVGKQKNELKVDLYQRLGMPQGLPLLLSPLVQEHYVSGRPECDFQDYRSMAEFWVKSLGEVEGFNVVINLHPSHGYHQDIRGWDYLEKWGVRICQDDLTRLIPLCDLYVAAGSSTIPWAIACSIPVINYDIYRYGLTIYRNTPGVLEVREQEDFLDALKKMTSDPDYMESKRSAQASHANRWGRLDGKAVDRLGILLDQLKYKKRGAPAVNPATINLRNG